jgi:hypothetical protein
MEVVSGDKAGGEQSRPVTFFLEVKGRLLGLSSALQPVVGW